MRDADRKTERREATGFLRGAEYLGSFPGIAKLPALHGAPLVAFTGRSNSGKSSLISALCDQKNLARASGEPGKTRSINLYRIAAEKRPPRGLILADLPGFGYARLSQSERAALRKMVDGFLLDAPALALTVLVLDCRREPGEEESSIIEYCRLHQRALVFVRTKWDKLSKRERSAAQAAWGRSGLGRISIGVSNTNGEGLAEALDRINVAVGSGAAPR